VISRHVSQGQVEHVKQALPKSLRQIWDEAEVTPPVAAEIAAEELSPVI